jgi:hypothetical protein
MQEWAAEMAQDIKRAVDQGWRAVDRQEERYYAGPCGNQVNDPAGLYVCPTVLWVRLNASTIRCRTCHQTYDATSGAPGCSRPQGTSRRPPASSPPPCP